jgi:hypothetical protein
MFEQLVAEVYFEGWSNGGAFQLADVVHYPMFFGDHIGVEKSLGSDHLEQPQQFLVFFAVRFRNFTAKFVELKDVLPAMLGQFIVVISYEVS